MQLNLSGVTPEARPIMAAAADIYLRHTRQWLVGLVAHGSAIKGGFIPGCSDVDLQLYLDDAAFAEDGHLPIGLCLAIQRDLAPINPAPFAYIQCYALPCRVPAGQVGPVPGAYAVLTGQIPVPEATASDLVRQARDTLTTTKVDATLRDLITALLQHGDGKLERQVRLLCTDVWPALYSYLTLRSPDPLAIWRLPKDRAIALLSADEDAGQQIRAFHAALLRYHPSRRSITDALAIMEHGTSFLRAVRTL